MNRFIPKEKKFRRNRREEALELNCSQVFVSIVGKAVSIILLFLIVTTSMSVCMAEYNKDMDAYNAFLFEKTLSIMPRRLLSNNVDAEGPIIDISSISITKISATIGDTVTLKVAITDAVSGVNFAYAYYTMPQSGDSYQIALIYNPTSDKYEGTYSITNKSENGKWVLSTIQTADKEGHYTYARSGLDKGNFTIYGTADVDFSGPFIDISTIEITQTYVTVDESISVSMMITDDNSGVNMAYVYYTMPLSGDTKQIALTYNPLTEEYEGTYFVTNKSENGKWELTTIQTADKAGHYSYARENLEKGDFTVYGTTGADWEGPVIDLSTLQVSRKSALNGESVIISVDISDNISGVAFAYAYYQMPLSNDSKQIPLKLNPESGKYEGEYVISSRTEYGLWTLMTIQTADNERHYTYARSYMYPDMSNAGFYADPNENHTIVHDPGILPTYTQTGLTAGQYCSVCSFILVPQEIIPVIPRLFSLTLPSSLTKIENEAFSDDQSIISIEIPEECTSVGQLSFSNCENLIFVSVKNGDCTIADDAFLGCHNVVIITVKNSKVEKWATKHNYLVAYYQ